MTTVSDWGPAAWKFLHAITFSFPELPTLSQQTSALHMFRSLADLLPCEQCRLHYTSELEQAPPDVRSRSALSQWLVDLHNRVNARLGKPSMDYAAAERLYASQCSLDCQGTPPSSPATTAHHSRAAASPSQGYAILMVLGVVGFLLMFFIAFNRQKAMRDVL